MEISYSVVLYKNSIQQVQNILNNIVETVPVDADYKIYFINNLPTDKKITKFIENLSLENKKVFSFSPVKNIGFGGGNNLAINKLTSEYHIIMNPDVTIPDKKQVYRMIKYMKKENIVLLSPLIKYPNGKIQQLVKRTPTIFDMFIRFVSPNLFKKRQSWFTYGSNSYETIHEGNNFPGSFLVCHTKELIEVGGFDEQYFLYMEDSDLSRAMTQKGKAVFFPYAYIYHVWQRKNRKSLKGIIQMLKSMIVYFHKWGWKLF